MNVQSLTVSHFRNLTDLTLEPSDGVNVIYGENAQGKTNLIESIWMFTGLRSFRGSREKELLQFGEDRATLSMHFFNDVRKQNAQITISDKKQVTLGGVKLSSGTEMAGEFLATVFSPGHLDLIQGGPSERRKFLNQALCQLKPNYAKRLSDFNRILQQRNMLLKDLRFHSELLDMLDIWDDNFARFCVYLARERARYFSQLDSHLRNFYTGISGGREEIGLSYETDLFSKETDLLGSDPQELKEEVLFSLRNHRAEDQMAGFSTIGPHRDDMAVTLNGISAKAFGSQGQQRSCALSLKMAEAAVVRDITGKQPIVLLDDVMSELDSRRQDYILNHIEGWQVFLTCCEPSTILFSQDLKNGRLFEIKGGSLCSST